MADTDAPFQVAAQSAGGSHHSQREDARLWRRLTDTLTIYLLADGSHSQLEGKEAAWAATQSCVREVERALGGSSFHKQDARRLLVRGVEAAHERVQGLCQESGAKLGTSLIVALHYASPSEQHVWIAHVGDARAFLYRGGSLARLTTDQTVVGQLVAQGKLSEGSAANHPQVGVLLQTVGGNMKLQPEFLEQPLRSGDRLLLCNHTVVQTLGDEHIASLLGNDAEAGQVVRWLTRRAILRGEGENTTSLLVDIKPGGRR